MALIGEPVRMRMLRPYGRYRVGQVIQLTGGQARTFEIYKYAQRVPAEPQLEFATASEPAELERADAPVAKARRRKRA